MIYVLGAYQVVSNFWANSIVKVFEYLILPIVVLVGAVVITTALYQHFKYGTNVMPSFKPKDISNCRDQLLFLTLDRISGYKKLVRTPQIKSNYIMVDKGGVSIFKLFTQIGSISGNVSDNELQVRQNYNQVINIPNPYIDLTADENLIKGLMPNVKITKYLITMEGSYIAVNSDTKVIKYNQMLYQVKDDNLYDNKTVDAIYNQINKCQEVSKTIE